MAVTPTRPRTIWYMGAKTRLLDGFLQEGIRTICPSGGRLVDLFSGTGVVGWALSGDYRIVANDVQAYAATIARALLEAPSEPAARVRFLEELDPDADLREAFEEHRALLVDHLGPALSVEQACLDREEGAPVPSSGLPRPWRSLLAEDSEVEPLEVYRRFLAESPHFEETADPTPSDLYASALTFFSPSEVRERRGDRRCLPYIQTLAYHANIYFGLRQAIAIDSLRYAIAGTRGRRRVHYLAALLYTASRATSGTSHFAQPRSLKKDSEVRAVMRRRRIDIYDAFCEASRELARMIEAVEPCGENLVTCRDWRQLLSERGDWQIPGPVDCVYADPPYTADHYARFYHVLEALVDYDYPELALRKGRVLKGRYPVRRRRFVSGFSRPSRVADEFRDLFEATARSGAALALSYSTTGGLLLRRWAEAEGGGPGALKRALTRLSDLAGTCFDEVELKRRPVRHSGQGDSVIRAEEILLLCASPRDV